jgi:hypothetical protein
MRRCSGNDTQEWGFDSIFDVKCPHCGQLVEFFKDEISRRCPQCRDIVISDRKVYGCSKSCGSESALWGGRPCSKFRRSKARFYGHMI